MDGQGSTTPPSLQNPRLCRGRPSFGEWDPPSPTFMGLAFQTKLSPGSLWRACPIRGAWPGTWWPLAFVWNGRPTGDPCTPPTPRFPSIISKCCPCTEMCKECWAHFKSRSVLPSCPLVVFFCFVLFFFCLCQFHFHQCCWEVLASSTFTDAEYYQSFSFFAHLMGRKIPNIILTCISQGPICNLSNNCLLSVQQIFLYTI